VVITVLTGSLISALSLGLMLLVSRQLRVGLFELDTLQERLKDSRKQLDAAERERIETRRATVRIEAELKAAEQRANTLRQELAPLQKQRQTLEADRDRLSRDIAARDLDIQRTEAELNTVRNRIKLGERELKDLERNLVALRRGAVVLRSGQILATATVRMESPDQAKQVVDRLLQEANFNAYGKVLPGQAPDQQIIRVPRSDVKRLQGIISKPGTWVISLRSATNVLRGETVVYAFPEVHPNRLVTKKGDVLASVRLDPSERSNAAIRTRLNLLLASAYAEAKRRGSLTAGLQFDGQALAQLGQTLMERSEQGITLQAISTRDSNSADPIFVAVESNP
jgi:uncharacterized protein (DUF3084 family)